MPGEQIVELRACRYSHFSDSLRRRNWPALPIHFGANFRFFSPKNLGNFSSVISTNFANFGAKFAKFSTSQIWKKKHWWEWVHF
jgi:hypothetical protein